MHIQASTNRSGSAFAARLFSVACFAVGIGQGISVGQAEDAKPEEMPSTANAASQPAAAAQKNDNSFGETVKLDEFVVSGTLAPRRKLDSATAITTIDTDQMKVLAPVGLPELMKHIPGLVVNSSGGETRSNVFSRGLPATGGFVFVGLQEDGLPDISEMNLRNMFNDLLTRSTSFTERIENVRGGSSGIFQSNVPGGIINLISREGSETRRGEVTVTTSDYNQFKVDGWTSGPIRADTGYAVGLFYRRDDGIRSTGYTANKGYMLEGNVKHTFANDRGFIKLGAKWLDDRTTFYIAIPMQDARNPHGIPGFDIRTGTQYSEDLRHVVVPNTPRGTISADIANGGYPKMATVSATLELKFAEGWKLQDHARYTNLVYNTASFLTSGVAQPVQSYVNALGAAAGAQFAAAKASSGNYSFQLHLPGQGGAAVASPTTMNGNGLVMNLTDRWGYSYVTDWQNDARIIKTLPNNGAIALGLYNSWLKMPRTRNIDYTMLTDVRSNPSRVDVEYLNAATGASLGYATYNGIRQVSPSAQFRDYSTDIKDLAPFFNVEQPFGNWTLDAGLRSEWKDETLVLAGTKTYDLNAPGQNILALRNAGFSDGVFTPHSYSNSATTWTAGANYRFNNRFSSYGRFMSGYRMPISDDFLARIQSGTDDAGPTNRITQLEGGVKYATKKLSVFATLIGSKLTNQLFSGLVAQPDGSLVTRNVTRDTQAYGVELEVYYTPIKPVTLHLVATEQRATFTSHNLVANPANSAQAVDIKGNRVINMPDRYSILDASYRFPELSFGRISATASWEYMGDTAIDEANRSFVPAYNVFNVGVALARQRWTLRLNVRNALNNDAMINGDARSSQVFSDPSAAYLNARTILPRTFVGSVTYSF